MASTSAAASSSTASHPDPHHQPRYIDDNHVELHSVIGTGAYGVVYLALDSRTPNGMPVWRAVKCLRRNGLDARQRHFQRREIALHRLASAHPSIITMDRLVEEGEFTYVVMDYGEEGDLFAMITDRQRYVGYDELIRNVFLQLLDGVHWLHTLGISHRDIKPENIVCSSDGTRVRICDFGLATSESHSSEFGCGSTFYIAPECLGEWFPDRPAYPTRPGDVWSLGVILVNLICGRNPWRIASPADESFNAYLQDPHFLRRILPISHQALFVLSQIFTVDPAQRIDLPTLRKLVLEIDTFSMDEEELRAAHYAAQPTTAYAPPAYEELASLPEQVEPMEQEGDWADETVFIYDEDDRDDDDDDEETPSLRADSGSPSPPTHRSRSASSNGGSLPPTPLMQPEPPALPPTTPALWDLFKARQHPSQLPSELRINPTSPDVTSATGPSPFFR